ncbi:Part of AAA domain-containing protein [Ruminococcus sp. YE71]|uniref:AAA domain-containing protein n=1 Tax=unclassified Ruminococcus TaxID=2608920 RepID=UPI00087DFBD3|nr:MULTISPECIES: AAA domain-containing protein [unclassified Ruminococcus]SDA26684.1 Part of AAA domain-containing protein [Ruminococcus sp. YE78]SFW44387.1 Part of AAA domain-containing protein [Ruminococcus sp. YE71]
MAEKSRILEAWIMVEHLSEGDIKVNDKSLYKFSDGDFHGLLKNAVARQLTEKRKKGSKKSGGIIVYLDIFEFREVVVFLREKYRLETPPEEPRVGNKFGLAVCFDEDLNFMKDMTFFTESEYIRLKKEIPDESVFSAFEEELKTELEQSFEKPEDAADYAPVFNDAMAKLIGRIGTSPEKCRFRVLKNLESDAVNLHSFFIGDLETAKKTDTDNLNDYLFGYSGKRVDLDSKNSSPKFAPSLFEDILRPKNYPLGRFPSCTKFSLSLMQQTAVNLSAGYDDRKIRSVNGPPGTGKTTLLKDIFAELVVRQAACMAEMSERKIVGGEKTRYFNNASIGELPDEIAENGIVVASSNNGAVQNIVKELPLIKDIDEGLIGELKEADYFMKLSNSKLSSKWVENEKGRREEVLICEETDEPDKYWGLFSLEGGRSENMANIITNVKHICKMLESEYDSDPEVYSQFRKDCEAVKKLREQAAAFADECGKVLRDSAVLREHLAASGMSADTSDMPKMLADVRERRRGLGGKITQLSSMLSTMKDTKPGIFAPAAKKREYNDTVNETNSLLLAAMKEDETLAKTEKELEAFTQSAALLEKQKSEKGIKPLDMSIGYDELQLSNPWFGEEYRIAQSRLFISALRVRKQFLAENVKNLKAAVNIWHNQKTHIENKRLIKAAWNWINLAIPVISSTFASFSRMCANLERDTLGHLFVDEAGQAVPQAAVGAVLRSRNVMVVGDPSQIKPVLTLDGSVLKMLGRHFGVSEKYLSENASAQTLVDQASRYGFYYDENKAEDSWIGIPLWVHRRCGYPMFTISNRISYHDMMVQGKEYNGRTGWFDVRGNANDKYVSEQGDFLAEKLAAMMRDDPEIGDKTVKDKVYIISPFANVAYMLAQRLRSIGFTRFDEKSHKATNVGTIHTFQGKEADIVFMVLGADSKSKGASKWAVDEPNMMNVAATRAKKEFYIVGDMSLYKSLGSDVADETAAVMRKYAKDHPDLYDSKVSFAAEPSEPVPAEKEKPAEKPRLSGRVVSVRDGRQSKYAQIKGSDGQDYTVNETVYDATPNASEVIKVGAEVTFRPLKKSGKYFYVDSVEKA